MSHVIIDRRLNGKGKSSVNRQRFIRRVKAQVKEAVKEKVRDGQIKDVVSDSGKKIKIRVKDLNEPMFNHGEGGVVDHVMPGNKKFKHGDRMNRPPKGGGGGDGSGKGEASPDGEGSDEYEFELSKEEFLDMFFEDLELPDMVKKTIAITEHMERRRAGYVPEGSPSRLNIVRSMKNSKARLYALRNPKRKKLLALEEERDRLVSEIENRLENGLECSIERTKLREVLAEIEALRRKLKAVPFIDNIDLKYNQWTTYPVPTTKAVMFCIMDVSGSMGQWEKEMAKSFFMILYLFLFRNYDKVEIIFIRHHTTAKEVDENEFYYSRESGGTLISPSLELMRDIVKNRYSLNEWNIYACQASDGDNWTNDNPNTVEVLTKDILTVAQYFAYVELRPYDYESDIWADYKKVAATHANFAMRKIQKASDIWPVFKGLFEKRQKSER